MRNNKPIENHKKAKEVILHILNRCGKMNKEKLSQLLYFIDFDYYEKHEEQLMGLKYNKK